jgi:hypothetical protein
MQDRGCELPRKPLLGTSVNNGKKKGRSCSKPRPDAATRLALYSKSGA